MIKKIIFLGTGLVFLVSLLTVHAEVSEENWPAVKKEVLSVYKSPEAKKDVKLRLKTLSSLDQADYPEMIKLLAETVIPTELELDAPMVLDTIITIIGQVKKEETILTLVETTKKANPVAKIILLNGMGYMEHHPLIIKQLLEFLKDTNPVLQRTAINSLAAFHPTEAFPEIIKALESKEWEVRLSAIKYLKGLTDDVLKKKALEALIKRQPNETGRLRHEISEAISTLSKTAGKTDDNATVATFYGLSVDSKNLLFLIDVSSSMRHPDNLTEDGVPAMDCLKKELQAVIQNLPQDAKFNIITFSNEVKQWQSYPVFARQSRKEAIDWVGKLEPPNAIGTNTYDALALAYDIKAEGVKNGYKTKSDVDTIFLFSDGNPQGGKYDNPAFILKAVKSLNEFRRIRINTIGMKVMGDQVNNFLKQLAEENDGKSAFK